MKIIKYIIFVMLILASTTSLAKNLQVWQQENIQYRLSDQMTAAFQYETRVGVLEDYGVLENHFTPSFTWRPLSWFSIGPNYRYVVLRKNHKYLNDNRPGLDLTVYYTLDGFVFSNRSRFMIRQLEDYNPYFRYRNLSKVQYNGFGKYKPFISYEIFFDDGTKNLIYKKNDKISSYWTTIGMTYDVNSWLKIDLSYLLIMNRNVGNGGFKKPRNVISVAFNMLF